MQADWNVSDTDSDAYIKNKPDFTAKDLGNISSVRQSGYTAISAETWSKILSITLSAGEAATTTNGVLTALKIK